MHSAKNLDRIKRKAAEALAQDQPEVAITVLNEVLKHEKRQGDSLFCTDKDIWRLFLEALIFQSDLVESAFWLQRLVKQDDWKPDLSWLYTRLSYCRHFSNQSFESSIEPLCSAFRLASFHSFWQMDFEELSELFLKVTEGEPFAAASQNSVLDSSLLKQTSNMDKFLLFIVTLIEREMDLWKWNLSILFDVTNYLERIIDATSDSIDTLLFLHLKFATATLLVRHQDVPGAINKLEVCYSLVERTRSDMQGASADRRFDVVIELTVRTLVLLAECYLSNKTSTGCAILDRAVISYERVLDLLTDLNLELVGTARAGVVPNEQLAVQFDREFQFAVRFNLMRAYEQLGELEGALRHSAACVQLHQDAYHAKADLHFQVAKLCSAKAQYSEAAKLLQSVVDSLQPTGGSSPLLARALGWLGTCCAKLGQFDRAEREFARCLTHSGYLLDIVNEQAEVAKPGLRTGESAELSALLECCELHAEYAALKHDHIAPKLFDELASLCDRLAPRNKVLQATVLLKFARTKLEAFKQARRAGTMWSSEASFITESHTSQSESSRAATYDSCKAEAQSALRRAQRLLDTLGDAALNDDRVRYLGLSIEYELACLLLSTDDQFDDEERAKPTLNMHDLDQAERILRELVTQLLVAVHAEVRGERRLTAMRNLLPEIRQRKVLPVMHVSRVDSAVFCFGLDWLQSCVQMLLEVYAKYGNYHACLSLHLADCLCYLLRNTIKVGVSEKFAVEVEEHLRNALKLLTERGNAESTPTFLTFPKRACTYLVYATLERTYLIWVIDATNGKLLRSFQSDKVDRLRQALSATYPVEQVEKVYRFEKRTFDMYGEYVDVAETMCNLRSTEVCKQLYTLLIVPIEDCLKPLSHVAIVRDQLLDSLDFNQLCDLQGRLDDKFTVTNYTPASLFLITQHTCTGSEREDANEAQSSSRLAVPIDSLTTQTSTNGRIFKSDLIILPYQISPKEEQALLIGSPRLPNRIRLPLDEYVENVPQPEKRVWHFVSDMPIALDELQLVSKLCSGLRPDAKLSKKVVPAVEYLSGPRATKQQFLQRLEQSTLVHFAGHVDLENSALLFADANARVVDEPVSHERDPFTNDTCETVLNTNLSHLFVTADELFRLALGRCRLFVLVHRRGGQRANLVDLLLRAGVHSVLLIEKSIPDAVLLGFFKVFYTTLDKGDYVSRAARQANEYVRKRFSQDDVASVYGSDAFISLNDIRTAHLDRQISEQEKKTGKEYLDAHPAIAELPSLVQDIVNLQDSLRQLLFDETACRQLLSDHAVLDTVTGLVELLNSGFVARRDMLAANSRNSATLPNLASSVANSPHARRLITWLGFETQALNPLESDLKNVYVLPIRCVFDPNGRQLLERCHVALDSLAQLAKCDCQVAWNVCRLVLQMMPLEQSVLRNLVQLLAFTKQCPEIQLSTEDRCVAELVCDSRLKRLLSATCFSKVCQLIEARKTETNRQVIAHLLNLMASLLTDTQFVVQFDADHASVTVKYPQSIIQDTMEPQSAAGMRAVLPSDFLLDNKLRSVRAAAIEPRLNRPSTHTATVLRSVSQEKSKIHAEHLENLKKLAYLKQSQINFLINKKTQLLHAEHAERQKLRNAQKVKVNSGTPSQYRYPIGHLPPLSDCLTTSHSQRDRLHRNYAEAQSDLDEHRKRQTFSLFHNASL